MGNSRRSAAFIVARWIATKDFPSSMLPTGENRAFVQDIVYTTIRRIRPLRKILGMLMKQWPKGELEALLYVGAAQILYMPDVPDFAAVSETVDAAKGCENPSIAKVVNGVLRNVIRRREEFEKMMLDDQAQVVCLSTLMTPTMDNMAATVKLIANSGYRDKVIVTIGGPPTNDAFAKEIGADHRDENAQQCVSYVNSRV